MRRGGFVLLALCALIALVSAASPDSFCKCTCFSNSTIIRLGSGDAKTPGSASPETRSLTSKPRAPFNPLSLLPHSTLLHRSSSLAARDTASCALCNRAFCLFQHLPICKNAEEKDVFTTCFQRDSSKDQIIVLLFMAATIGLLGWAGVKRILERRESGAVGLGISTGLTGNTRSGEYAPVGR